MSYKRIFEVSVVVPYVDPSKAKALACLLISKVSSKIHIFGRHLLLNKLPMRMELAKRDIIEDAHNVVCPLCFVVEEDIDHLFGSYPVF